jgi:hypothetical protein
MYFIYQINEILFTVSLTEPFIIVNGGTRVIVHFPENYSAYKLVTADDLLEVSRARGSKEYSNSRPHRVLYIMTQMQMCGKEALTDLL